EGIGYQVADLIDAMHADTGKQLKELRVDGGASLSAFLMQFQADLLQIPVVRPAVTETTALGAAYLAGGAGGLLGERGGDCGLLEERGGYLETMARRKNL